MQRVNSIFEDINSFKLTTTLYKTTKNKVDGKITIIGDNINNNIKPIIANHIFSLKFNF